MSDEATVRRLLCRALFYGLGGAVYVSRIPIGQLAAEYNGIGPEWFPDALRAAIDAICSDLCPAALIHDVRFAHSDGSVEQFVAANDEFLANGRIIADKKYSWYDPRRYVLRHRAKVFYRLCRDFGWTAYLAAYVSSQRTASLG